MDRAGTMPIFLLETNITPVQNNKALTASSFTFNPLQIYSTCNKGTDKNKQLTFVKPTQNGINCNKSTFCVLKSLNPLKNSKTSRVP
jgi:hypothetical protein